MTRFFQLNKNRISVYQKHLDSLKFNIAEFHKYVPRSELCRFPYRGQQLFYLLVFFFFSENIWALWNFILRLSWKWVHSEPIFPLGTVVMRTNTQYNTMPFLKNKKYNRKRAKEWNELYFGLYGCLFLWRNLNKSKHKNVLNMQKNSIVVIIYSWTYTWGIYIKKKGYSFLWKRSVISGLSL